jgi:hypothetical protein
MKKVKPSLKGFLGKVKAFLDGEPVRPVCRACQQEVVGPGYRHAGELFCDVWCLPPVLFEESRRAGEGQ